MIVPIKDLADYSSAAMAIIAVTISLFSLVYARRSLKITEAQELRRKPILTLGLLNSYLILDPELGRIYSFHISVRNPSDADNAIAGVEFAINYSIGETSYNVKLTPSGHLVALTDGRQQLPIPIRTAAHDTVSGWCDFLVRPELLNQGLIDSYKILITDSHQVESRLEVSVVPERADV